MPGNDERRALVIDCDPGLDDAIAIALAAMSPELEISAITTVCGNAPITRVTDNALAITASLGLKTPVYEGADSPLHVSAHYGTDIWGGDGDLGLKRPRRGAQSEHAQDYLERLFVHAAPHSLLLCQLAPLTNLARLLTRRPELADRIDRLMIMGGALGAGNATRSAELNIWFDPHAAARVFSAGIPAVVVPLDLTRTVIMDHHRIGRLERGDTAAAELCAKLLPLAQTDGQPEAIHDVCVIACLLWPELFSWERGTISVATGPGPARGQTRFSAAEAGPHTILTAVEHEVLLDRIVNRLLRPAPT